MSQKIQQEQEKRFNQDPWKVSPLLDTGGGHWGGIGGTPPPP